MNFSNIQRQSGFIWLAPIISGLAAIGGFIVSFITVTLASKAFKIAFALAVAAAYAALFLAFVASLYSVIEGAAANISFPEPLQIAASWVIPSNINTVLSGVASISIIQLVFRYKSRVIDLIRGGS